MAANDDAPASRITVRDPASTAEHVKVATTDIDEVAGCHRQIGPRCTLLWCHALRAVEGSAEREAETARTGAWVASEAFSCLQMIEHCDPDD